MRLSEGFKYIHNLELRDTILDFNTSRFSAPTLFQFGYVECFRLSNNGRYEELRYCFGKFIKAQEASLDEQIRKQNSEEALSDIHYLYEGANEKTDIQSTTHSIK